MLYQENDNLRLYIDSADKEEIGHLAHAPYVKGITTNPKLIAKAAQKKQLDETEYFSILKKLREMVRGEFFIQLTSTEPGEAVYEIAKIRELISQPLVIKIPATLEGLYAISKLTKEGVSTAATAVYTPTQAYLAVTAGAKYVIPYYSRIDQFDHQGIDTVKEMLYVVGAERVLVASIKSPVDVHYLLLSGVHNMTLPYPLLKEISIDELTTEVSQEFAESLKIDWNKRKQRNGHK